MARVLDPPEQEELEIETFDAMRARHRQTDAALSRN